MLPQRNACRSQKWTMPHSLASLEAEFAAFKELATKAAAVSDASDLLSSSQSSISEQDESHELSLSPATSSSPTSSQLDVREQWERRPHRLLEWDDILYLTENQPPLF